MKGEMEVYLVKPEEHEISSPQIELQVIGQISRTAANYAD